MTNREKFNQCLMNYVKGIINMENEAFVNAFNEAFVNAFSSSFMKNWVNEYFENFLKVYGYQGHIKKREDVLAWLNQECIENVES